MGLIPTPPTFIKSADGADRGAFGLVHLTVQVPPLFTGVPPFQYDGQVKSISPDEASVR